MMNWPGKLFPGLYLYNKKNVSTCRKNVLFNMNLEES